jgi:hypothetical protein
MGFGRWTRVRAMLPGGAADQTALEGEGEV